MTEALSAPAAAAAPVARGEAAGWVRGAVLVAGLAGAVLLFRPYMGFFGDARIYLGRALADLDPQGVGRDLMFAHDGQSGFSVFPAVLAKLVGALGQTRASVVTAAAALTLWTGSAALALRAGLGRGRWLASLLAVIVLPSAYGGFALSIGEAAAVPRPFAEAFVLLGLAALLTDRFWAAGALIACAATLHPIMALPGFGVLYLFLAFRDRRWWWAAPVGLCALAGAAWLRLPLAERLPQRVDAAWLDVLTRCSPYLFLKLWPAAMWGKVLAQVATVAVAAGLSGTRMRRLLGAVLVVALVALAADAVLGDGAKSVLVLQMQPWRGLWLLSFAASAALPVVAYGLWSRGPAARLAVGAMVAAWASVVLASMAGLCTLLMLALVWAERRGARPPRLALMTGWALVISLVGLYAVTQTQAVISTVAGQAPESHPPLHFYAVLDFYRVAAEVAVLAGGAWLCARGAPLRLTAPLAAAALLAGALTWNSLDASREVLDSPAAAREVRGLVAGRPGAVEWLGGDLQPVVLAGRPSWHTEMQGASSVFSREQAMEWSRRTARLVETRAGPRSLLTRFPHERPAPLWYPSEAALAAFCGASDAPAWFAVPYVPGAYAPPADARIWASALREPFALRSGGPIVLVDRYAFLPCAGVRGAGAGPTA